MLFPFSWIVIEHNRYMSRGQRLITLIPTGLTSPPPPPQTAKFRSSVVGRAFLARADELRAGTAVVTLAQAEPVRAAALLHTAAGPPSPRPADPNNNTAKRTSPPPRADQVIGWGGRR